MPSSNIKLPVEILSLITGHLWNSPETVKASSLTCRAWYAASRPHVYRCIILRSGRDLDALLSLLRNSTERAKQIGFRIKELRIMGDPRQEAVPTHYWILRASAALPPLLPCLQVLHLQNVGYQSPFLARFLDRLSGFTTVQELIVMRSEISLEVLQALVGSFPGIATLRLLLLQVADEPRGLGLTYLGSPWLKTLIVQFADEPLDQNVGFCSWLATLNGFTRLAIGGESCISCDLPDNFINHVAPSVEHLHILTLHLHELQDTRLQWFTNLRTIDFHQISLTKPSIPLWLDELPNPAILESIKFMPHKDQVAELNNLSEPELGQHAELDQTLTQDRFARLHDIVLIIPDIELPMDTLIVTVQSLFKRTKEKRCLRVFAGDPENKPLTPWLQEFA